MAGGRLVVSAHLDDAVLSAFSLLGPGTTVVTVLAGLPPAGVLPEWDRITGATDSRERVVERRAEDHAAIEPTGAEVLHLGFADSQYVEVKAMPAPAPGELADALRPFLDGEVHAPAGIGNADHRLVRDAVLAVRPDAVLYADLPYALRDGFELPAGLVRPAPADVTLDGDLLAAKLAAFEQYATQVALLVELFGDFRTAEGLGVERLWRPGA